MNFPILATENKQETWTPQEGIPDRHIWRFSDSGEYSAKSAYEILFQGAVYFGPAQRIWKSHAPPKCRFFMWLAAHNRCWTADRLADEASPTQPNVCCVIKKRRISNIFSSVAYSPGNFGSLSSGGLASPHSPPSPKKFHSMTGGRRRKPRSQVNYGRA